MSDRREVRLRLESAADGERQVRTMSGEWFRKEKSIYIRYEETEGNGGDAAGESVRALLRYRPGELSLVRRGALESEQRFAPGARLRGHYRSPFAAFELETETSGLDITPAPAGDPPAPPFLLEWRYKLWVGGQLSGHFHIKLNIEPV